MTFLRGGLRAQLVWSLLLTIIVILNVAAWFFHSRARDYFDNQLGQTLISLAQSGADLMDADLLEFLRPGYEGGEFYKDLQRNLEILKTDFQVHRLFIVDSTFKTLLDTDPGAPIGMTPPHLQINLVEVKTAVRGTAVYSTLYRSYDGNLYKSAYAPLYDKQGMAVAVVCVDASPAFLHVIDRITNLIITLNLVSIVAAVLISLVLARSILKPVHLLVAGARRLSQGDFNHPVRVDSRNEIGFLAQVFNSMQDNIKMKEERLEKLKAMAEGRAKSIQSYNDYILSSITHGILTCDLRGKITIINPAAEQILELSGKDAAGKNHSEVLGADHPFSSFINNAMRSMPDQTEKELEVILVGRKKILSADASPLLDSEEKIIGLNFVITDLTEIRELREDIKEKERLAYLGELSATIAHEIRNPLNSIELFVGLLKTRIQDPNEREDAIDKIQKEIWALNTFVTDFLTFARPGKLQKRSFLLTKLFQEVIFLSWKDLQDKQIDVTINLQDQGLKVNGDFEQLKRGFLNVVLNAVQSMEPGGILTLAARSQNGVTTKGQVQIEICDTGEGIDEKDYDRIFQPFYSTRGRGTGLGLAIVKNIVHAHHGMIVVQPNEPRGTRFIFRL